MDQPNEHQTLQVLQSPNTTISASLETATVTPEISNNRDPTTASLPIAASASDECSKQEESSPSPCSNNQTYASLESVYGNVGLTGGSEGTQGSNGATVTLAGYLETQTPICITEALLQRISYEVREAVASQRIYLAEHITASLRENFNGKRFLSNRCGAAKIRGIMEEGKRNSLKSDARAVSPAANNYLAAPNGSHSLRKEGKSNSEGELQETARHRDGMQLRRQSSEPSDCLKAGTSEGSAATHTRSDYGPRNRPNLLGAAYLLSPNSGEQPVEPGRSGSMASMSSMKSTTRNSHEEPMQCGSSSMEAPLSMNNSMVASARASDERLLGTIMPASLCSSLSPSARVTTVGSVRSRQSQVYRPGVKALEAALATGLLENEKSLQIMKSTPRGTISGPLSGRSSLAFSARSSRVVRQSEMTTRFASPIQMETHSNVSETMSGGESVSTTEGEARKLKSKKSRKSSMVRLASSIVVNLSSTVRQSMDSAMGPNSTSLKSARSNRTEQLAHIPAAPKPSDASDGDGSISSDDDELEPDMRLSTFLKFYGILPWQTSHHEEAIWKSLSTWYQWFMLLLVSAAFAACVEATISANEHRSVEGSSCYGEACLRLGLLSDLSLALGGILGLAAVGAQTRSPQLQECLLLLLKYARREGFFITLRQGLRWDLVRTLLVLLGAIFARAQTSGALAAAGNGTLDVLGYLQILAFTICFGVLMGLTYSILQAILRKASESVERCFFVLQTTTLGVMLLGVADVVQNRNGPEDWFVTLIPGLLVTAGIAQIFFSAASVTDKCAHVPSLINSLHFGEDIDVERQYVVEYIIHSAAGFYVFEVRLTQALALKFTYFVGVAALSATTIMGM